MGKMKEHYMDIQELEIFSNEDVEEPTLHSSVLEHLESSKYIANQIGDGYLVYMIGDVIEYVDKHINDDRKDFL